MMQWLGLYLAYGEIGHIRRCTLKTDWKHAMRPPSKSDLKPWLDFIGANRIGGVFIFVAAAVLLFVTGCANFGTGNSLDWNLNVNSSDASDDSASICVSSESPKMRVFAESVLRDAGHSPVSCSRAGLLAQASRTYENGTLVAEIIVMKGDTPLYRKAEEEHNLVLPNEGDSNYYVALGEALDRLLSRERSSFVRDLQRVLG